MPDIPSNEPGPFYPHSPIRSKKSWSKGQDWRKAAAYIVGRGGPSRRPTTYKDGDRDGGWHCCDVTGTGANSSGLGGNRVLGHEQGWSAAPSSGHLVP